MKLDEQQVTYTETPGGWFADYRDESGVLVQTGIGATQADALAHLAGRMVQS
jgi:hypothetical protein